MVINLARVTWCILFSGQIKAERAGEVLWEAAFSRECSGDTYVWRRSWLEGCVDEREA